MTFEIDLTGRTVLVTGAGAGVGKAIASSCARAGARVVVNDVDRRRVDQVVDELRDGGGEGIGLTFDVGDHQAVMDAVASAGPVDVLVNNAGNAGVEGFGARGPFAESEPDDWDPFIRVNLNGALNCCRAVLPSMIDSGWGRIVTIVSDAARAGDPGGAVYGASKAAAAGLTRSVALENGRHGITANNIALGTMHTEATDSLWGGERSELARGILRDYVVRRPGRPDEAASLVVYLASEHGSWITGQTYALNGGYTFSL